MDLVKTVFTQMGGTVIEKLPRRPNCEPRFTPLTIERDNFMMDFENACLSKNWDSRSRAHLRGPNRYKDPEWAAVIQSQVYPHHSDIDWEEYVDWVSRGHGDEWFQEEEDEDEDDDHEEDDEDEDTFRERMLVVREEQAFLPGYYEAQTRLRTAYSCRDMVRPLSTPLDDRITALALIINEQR